MRPQVTLDGNEAAACVAHKLSEVIAIYPITPASPMGEWSDAWSAEGRKNLWGTVPLVVQMQSEGGAAGAVHGALQTGALATTFTASQGLLLMIPNMYKIAGELTPLVIHVAARSLAVQALSIFGDHSDVMATRSTGFAFLVSSNVQEVLDMSLVAHAATLRARVPFLHFFDGFRTSHEVAKVEMLADDDLRALVTDDLVLAHRARRLTPDDPVLRGTAQNPDVYFQARETVNPFYLACPAIVQETMDQLAARVGRSYRLFDYVGAPDAERVIVIMGSGAEAVHETVDVLNARGEKVGLLKVRLFRPFSVPHFIAALPTAVKTIAVLDRTKEPGSAGEPLYQDVLTAVSEACAAGQVPFRAVPRILGGRYGLSSKEFTPAMVKGVFDEMRKPQPKNHFTVGIRDDVTHTSLDYDPAFSTEPPSIFRAMFYGLGADGTVGANKNSIKIIGEATDNFVQGYFVYDSKKSGSVTISHLRFGKQPIRSTYLINRAEFIGCHQTVFLQRYDILENAAPGAVLLLNSPAGPDQVWDTLPRSYQEHILRKKLRFFTIDATTVARQTGMGARINTIMQTCFFAISGVLPREEAIAMIKKSIEKTYGAKGEKLVEMNFRAVDQTLAALQEVRVPHRVTSTLERPPVVSHQAPEFVQKVTAAIIAGQGDFLPVSALPADGTYPLGTAAWEKRNIAQEIPAWDPPVCIQCGKCAIVCPHATIRIKVYDPQHLSTAPPTFKWMKVKDRDYPEGYVYTIQVAAEDCTGCGICVDICPARNKSETCLKAINMTPQAPLRDAERVNYDFFLQLPEYDRRLLKAHNIRQNQIFQPLFEYSGACTGCGETPYLKLATQLFGDRMIVANATGCSSIYGGNLPTTPWTRNNQGRGPAWSNSLFEDNAEFGFGFRLTIDKHREFARELLQQQASSLGEELVEEILRADQSDEPGIYEQRLRVEELKRRLAASNTPEARQLLSLADFLVRKSVWIIGGDGWGYDIGFGGLDHIFAAGRDVNILLLDTEVYSNTGGQMSKATPLGAVAKFAAAGKQTPKKDLAAIAMTYGQVYVAQVALGANDTQTVRAFLEAEAYPGPSLIIAYSHCIAHGINMRTAMGNQKAAVESAYWPLFRYNPALAKEGKNPLILDSKDPKIRFLEYASLETRYKMLAKSHPDEYHRLMKLAQEYVDARWQHYRKLAALEAPAEVEAK
jgi:pyruvate-ferredoxin/flavodoxin oxidoreductase